MTEQSPSFGEELARLEEIVRRLENPEMDLDEALTLFEEGVGRLRTARARLAEAELTVKRVLEEADGTLGTGDVDD
jgi:exodeoxyribonuclease VII small subunit